jgi:hypothetical protein
VSEQAETNDGDPNQDHRRNVLVRVGWGGEAYTPARINSATTTAAKVDHGRRAWSSVIVRSMRASGYGSVTAGAYAAFSWWLQ